jgi:hypothetical protein
LNIFIRVEALTSEVLFHLWEYSRWKSNGAKSGLYGGYGRISQPQEFKRFTVAAAL